MGIRELQAQKAAARVRYEQHIKLLDEAIDKIRTKRDPDWKVKQAVKYANDPNWVYADPGRNQLPTHNGAPM